MILPENMTQISKKSYCVSLLSVLNWQVFSRHPFLICFSRLTLQMFSLHKNGKIIGWSCRKIWLKFLKKIVLRIFIFRPKLTSFFQDTLFLSSRLTLRMFSLHKNGKIIGWSCRKIWLGNTDCYQWNGSTLFGGQILFSKMPRKLLFKQWPYLTIMCGCTRTALFFIW